MTTRGATRRRAAAAAAAVTFLVALLGGVSPAWAGVAVTPSPDVPTTVIVGSTVAAQLTMTNANGGTESGQTDSVTSIKLVLDCGVQPLGSCDATDVDSNVLKPSTTGAGEAGTACAGVAFTIALTDIAKDEYTFSFPGSIVLTPAGPTQSCVVDFTASVERFPSKDANAVALGSQTDQLATVGVMASGGGTAIGTGTDEATALKATPILTTQIAPQTIALGQGFTDTATVNGVSTTGSVQFDVYGPNDATCTGSPALTSTKQLPAEGTSVASDTFTPQVVGTYRVIARYSGDANNSAVNTACNDPVEAVAVNPAAPPPPVAPPPPPVTPAMTTAASASVALGGRIADTATISGRPNPAASASVQFQLFSPGDIACTGAPVSVSTVAVSAAGTATSAPFTTTQAGVYRWRAFYSGDTATVPVSAPCNQAGETVRVTSTRVPQIVSARFAKPPVVGQPVDLVVRALDPRQEISGMQLNLGEAGGQTGISACRVPSLGRFPGLRTLTSSQTFDTPGHHTITVVVLAGDCTGGLHRAVTTIGVDVAPAAAARHTGRAVIGAPANARAAAVAATCKDRFLAPTSTLTRIRVAAAVLCLVNVERSKFGRKKLLRSPKLQLAANAHSSDMVRRRFFEHEHVPGGPKLVARLRKVGYRGPTYAENIGYGTDYNATLMVAAWMHSPGHRANILHPRLKFAGVGLTTALPVFPQRPGSTYTMDFGATLR